MDEQKLAALSEMFHEESFRKLKESGHLISVEGLEGYVESIKKNTSSVPDGNYWRGKRVLITGAAGMVGSTIADRLVELGAEVYGSVKRHAVMFYPNLHHHIKADGIKTVEVDLRDYGRVVALIKEIEPHVIFHQAAESFVPTSIKQPSYVVENNCVSTVNLLDAATKEDKVVEGIQLACSSEQYGFVSDESELPVKETNPLRPTSTYAATKVFTENAGKAYYYMYKTPAVITRTFNQEGPRRGPQFFTARVATQIVECLAGRQKSIVIGNPNSVRDFTHIHDSANAQIIAVEKCERGGAYNICSGKGITIADYVRLALRTYGLEGKVPAYVDKALLRPYERKECLFDGFIGDNSKFVERTGWRPTKSVVDIIRDGVEYYQGKGKEDIMGSANSL